MSKSGVYQITNLVNGKRYIGSSSNLQRRRHEHFYKLGKGSHSNDHLLKSYRKYGKENFRFQVLFLCDPELLLLFEQRAIDFLQPEYNECYHASHSTLGLHFKMSLATRLKMAAVPRTPEWREKIRQALLHRTFSPETLAKMSRAMKGRKRPHTEEENARTSAKLKARYQKMTPEERSAVVKKGWLKRKGGSHG